MTRPALLFALVFVFLGADAPSIANTPDAGTPRSDGEEACIQKNRDVGTQLAADIAAAATCKSDSDCDVVPVGACPLGCWAAVAKRHVQKIKPLIAEAVQRLDASCRCMYRCMAPPMHASCTKKKCTISKSR
jgi:hypothetical protein